MKRKGQHKDESAIEYLRRAVGWLDCEHENLLETLPSIEAVADFFDLWAAYDTDLWSGILECIADGDSPAKARAFVKKYKLPNVWIQDIDNAIQCRQEAAT